MENCFQPEKRLVKTRGVAECSLEFFWFKMALCFCHIYWDAKATSYLFCETTKGFFFILRDVVRISVV